MKLAAVVHANLQLSGKHEIGRQQLKEFVYLHNQLLSLASQISIVMANNSGNSYFMFPNLTYFGVAFT